MNNKKELLEKLKALAQRGVGGEKENAELLLKKLMKKYNISDEELERDSIDLYKIIIPRHFMMRKLASQVAYSVIGNDDTKGIYFSGNKNKIFYFKGTQSEFLEFEAKYKFYSNWLKKDLDIFYIAFLQKNEIFPPNVDCKIDLSEKDIQAINMCAGMEKHDYHLLLK